jgi:hypothetical protein
MIFHREVRCQGRIQIHGIWSKILKGIVDEIKKSNVFRNQRIQ